MGSGNDKRERNEFNMAVSYLNRLNQLLCMADEASITLDAYQWLHSLQAIFRELSTEMQDTEITKFNTTAVDINNDIYKQQSDAKRTGVQYMKPDLYNKLHNYELGLRKILKESGLQTKMVDEASKALK